MRLTAGTKGMRWGAPDLDPGNEERPGSRWWTVSDVPCSKSREQFQPSVIVVRAQTPPRYQRARKRGKDPIRNEARLAADDSKELSLDRSQTLTLSIPSREKAAQWQPKRKTAVRAIPVGKSVGADRRSAGTEAERYWSGRESGRRDGKGNRSRLDQLQVGFAARRGQGEDLGFRPPIGHGQSVDFAKKFSRPILNFRPKKRDNVESGPP